MSKFFDDLDRAADGKPNSGGPAIGKRFILNRLRTVTFDTEPQCIVEGLIPREGLVLVWGPPKCGKTFWTFDLAAHIALGHAYCDRDVEQGVVVYIACEGEHGVKTRAAAFCRARMGEAEDPPFFLMTTRLDLVGDIQALIDAVRAQLPNDEPIMAIVIDTLNRSIHGSESKDEDMGAYVAAADQLREAFRCTIALIHHCGIAGDRPRGHTSLTGAIDAQIAIKRDPDNTILATLELMKDGPEGAMMRCRLEVVDLGVDDRRKPITSCVVEHLGTAAGGERKKPRKLSATQARVLALLHEAINTGGTIPPASDHIPANTPCIHEEVFRQYCYQGGISTGSSQEARRAAYTRAVDTLLGDGHIGCWSEWFWAV